MHVELVVLVLNVICNIQYFALSLSDKEATKLGQLTMLNRAQ